MQFLFFSHLVSDKYKFERSLFEVMDFLCFMNRLPLHLTDTTVLDSDSLWLPSQETFLLEKTDTTGREEKVSRVVCVKVLFTFAVRGWFSFLVRVFFLIFDLRETPLQIVKWALITIFC